jgi:hypothetical protein
MAVEHVWREHFIDAAVGPQYFMVCFACGNVWQPGKLSRKCTGGEPISKVGKRIELNDKDCHPLFATNEFEILGTVRLMQWREGLVFWVGEEICWRSWDWPLK